MTSTTKGVRRRTSPSEPKVSKKSSTDTSVDGHDKANWRKSAPTDFTKSEEPEPHGVRRREILQKHPSIERLYSNNTDACSQEIISPIFASITLLIQVFMSIFVISDNYNLFGSIPWWAVFVLAYAIGGTCNHSLVLAMHELSHDLWFKKIGSFNPNLWLGYIVNIPTCVASMSSFKRYHLEHHSYQGSDKMDADLPTALEGKLFKSTLGKIIWVFLQPGFYGLRPLIVKPKPLGTNEIINWIIVGGMNLVIVKFLGVKALIYLAAGSILGLGLHPISGHFVAEHYEFVKDQETYSYYGPLNTITYNVGYHNEHHDFPRCRGRLLPLIKEVCRTGGEVKKKTDYNAKDHLLKDPVDFFKTVLTFGIPDWEVVYNNNEGEQKASPEFYEDLQQYDSWVGVLTGFIFGSQMNCFCRVTRK